MSQTPMFSATCASALPPEAGRAAVPAPPRAAPLWRADWKFLARWGHPKGIERLADGWLLSTVRTPKLDGFLLRLNPDFSVRETLLTFRLFNKFCLDRTRNAVFVMESDAAGMQAGAPVEACESRVMRLDLGTGETETLIEGRGGEFFALDLALADGGLVVSDPSRREITFLSDRGERLGSQSVGRRLVTCVRPGHGGVFCVAHSTINRFFRTSDPYDALYHAGPDGEMRRIGNSWLPGAPGHVYELMVCGERLLSASYHSLSLLDRGGRVLWRMSMAAKPWPGAGQEYFIGLFATSMPNVLRGISWGGSSDMVWELRFNEP